MVWFISFQPNTDKDQQSSNRVVNCSVPQGSVLGPQGFIAYTDDLAELIEEHLLGHHMYADDTQLMAHLTIQRHSNCCYKATELHQSHPGLVQFEKAPAESNKD